ncbi:MAG: Peptidase putative rane-associated zinc metallopeptidase, partial [Acidobacteria bacterium]|nr:Peptidase putative rane-associated zinc metallopeptidase [Acidobacteriota bacterium]
FGMRLFGFRRGDTDYRVSLIPLGGYVRMAGDTPEEARSSDPGEFLSKPKWQRFLILFAGPAVNILIALTFVAGISMLRSEQLISTQVIGEVTAKKPAARAGLQTGDRVVRVDGETIKDFDDLRLVISTHAGTPLRVDYLRAGVPHTTILTPEREESDFGPIGKAGIGPWYEPVIGRVDPGTNAERAGAKAGDRLIAANGQPIGQFLDLLPIIEKGKNAPLRLTVQRGPQQLTLLIAADPNRAYGITPPIAYRKLGFSEAIRDSLEQNLKMLKYAGMAIARIARNEGSVKELSGPINIARISGEMFRRGWKEVVLLMAMISLQLGVMNLLPIPVLDGGHIMILIIEGIARRDLSLRVKERIQQLGFAVLAALMIVVLFNDVIFNVMRVAKG